MRPSRRVILSNLVVLGQTLRVLFKEVRLKKMTLVSSLSRSMKVISTDTSTTGLHRTVSEINGDIDRKSQNFQPNLTAQLSEFRLN